MAIPAAALISGGLNLLGGINANKQQQQQQQQNNIAAQIAARNTPQFDVYQNPMFGYSASPFQDMMSMAMTNALFKGLAPEAGLNFGGGFGANFDKYVDPSYAWGGFPQQSDPSTLSGQAQNAPWQRDIGQQGTGGSFNRPEPTLDEIMPGIFDPIKSDKLRDKFKQGFQEKLDTVGVDAFLAGLQGG